MKQWVWFVYRLDVLARVDVASVNGARRGPVKFGRVRVYRQGIGLGVGVVGRVVIPITRHGVDTLIGQSHEELVATFTTALKDLDIGNVSKASSHGFLFVVLGISNIAGKNFVKA